MDFKQVGTLGTPIIIAAKNQLPELNGSYKGIFFKTTYDPSSEEDYPKGTILTVVENSDGTFSWSKPTILERLTNGITDGSQLLKDIEAFDGEGNKIVGTLESGSGTGDIKNPYKARTYSEMNGYRTKNYGNTYVEYTGQRQFTRNQIQDSSMYDKLYFDFPRQIGWVETFDWDNPDSNWTSDGLLYKCIVLFNVTPTKISDNTTEEAMPFSVYQMTTTRDSSDVQAGTVMYGIGFPSSFSWVSWGGTPDKEYSRTGYKLKITNVKREYYYLIGDIISTTGEWSQIIDGMQFGYKHGTYKIDINSKTVDNFQKLDLVLEDGGGGTANKTITNDYSYNLNSYYDYILKYSYEGKSSSVICKVGNFSSEGHIIEGAKQLYNTTSDGEPAGIFFSLDTNCPLPYGWNSGLIVDNLDLSTGQSASNKSVVNVGSGLYTLVGKTVTIEDISTAADMIYYTTLPSLSTPAAATDIVKGKQAIDAEGNRISGTLEPVVLPTLTNEGTAADLAAGKQLINSSGEVVTGTGTIVPTPGPESETRYFVKVIDYDGTELLNAQGENGNSFTLPPAPSHDGLVFQEWSASCPITNETVTIDNNNIMVGAVYTTASGLNEFDIELTEDFGLSVFLEIDGEKNWGDGTTDSEMTHTYAAYGNYTIKCGGTSLGGYFYSMPCTFARLATVTSISEFAFDGCHSLASITISNSLTSIGQSAFSGNGAFSGCSNLTSITIPNGITSINQNTFNNYNGLTSIIIPNSVTSIGQYAFNGCHSLTSIAIPDSVTSIDSYAFKDCNSLTSIATGNGVQNIYDNVFYNCNRLTNIIIGNNVTGIGRYAFYGCGKLTSITIPNSVMDVGNYAFQDCNMLTSVTIGNGMKSIGSYAFSNCSGLTSITIPDSVTSIGSYAFQNCNMLISVTLGNGIKSISSDAFQGCSSLTSITIPNSVTSISEYAFAACRSLTSIAIPNSVTSINKNAFAGCINLTSITIPNGMTSINEYTLSGCSGLTSITIPNSVTSIEYHAFSNCSRLTNITIPDSVTSIRGYVFSGCNKLASITIGSGVTSIGNYAFSGCNKLTSITIPNGVTSIGESAFGGCTGLANITLLPTTPPVLSYLSPFADIPSNAIFTVPKGTLNTYQTASGWSTYADKMVEATE